MIEKIYGNKSIPLPSPAPEPKLPESITFEKKKYSIHVKKILY